MSSQLGFDDHFFSELPAIPGFGSIDRLDRFYPVPDNWWIVIADVISSTRAVEQGQYKQVNMIGASCITAVINALAGIDIPYVFGGDGATLLIPDRAKSRAVAVLAGARTMAADEFNIKLRVGLVPVEEIRARGRDVRVARLKLSPGNYLAMFSGGGTELAERIIKQDNGTNAYIIPDSFESTSPDMTGLSCRWQPLRSRHGSVLCVLVQALTADMRQRHQLFSGILDDINIILGNELKQSSPVNVQNMRFKWPPDGLAIEARLTRGQQSFFRRYSGLLYQSFIQFILERFNFSAGGYNAPVYRKELRANADYRRFDDALRLVLDCTEQQLADITVLLDAVHQQGNIVYGLHQAPEAQMTCLVFNLESSEHLHFVDGVDGGFWAAANQLKQQNAELAAKN